MQAGKRKAMLKGTGVMQHFLLSPQSSALSPYFYLRLIPET
jgi:hypothetical protein